LFKTTEFISTYDTTLKIKLSLRDWIQQQIYFFGYYDKRGILFIKSHLKAGDTFIDVGGNIGAYSLIAAKIVGKMGTVVAFEPVTQVRKRLEENGALNQFQQLNVEPFAVFHENTALELHVSSKENFGMSSMHVHDEDTGLTESVKAVRFDDYAAQNGITRIDLVKMDIEGAELFALHGMKQTLVQLKPTVFIEICPGVLEGTTLQSDEIYAFFEAINYSPFCIGVSGEIIPFSPKNEAGYTNFVFISRDKKI